MDAPWASPGGASLKLQGSVPKVAHEALPSQSAAKAGARDRARRTRHRSAPHTLCALPLADRLRPGPGPTPRTQGRRNARGTRGLLRPAARRLCRQRLHEAAIRRACASRSTTRCRPRRRCAPSSTAKSSAPCPSSARVSSASPCSRCSSWPASRARGAALPRSRPWRCIRAFARPAARSCSR